MEKIKLLTDSACDIPFDREAALGIQILPFPITVGNRSCQERVDFQFEEFYQILKNEPRIPVTSHITQLRFEEVYEALSSQGYTDVIHVTISSTGSNTYHAATMAAQSFYRNHPQGEQMRIHIIDSHTYTLAYGYPLMEAAAKITRGATAQEIVAYLEDWFACVEIYFAPYTLKYVKKSGRVSCTAAFVGELVGLRPIISIIDGEARMIEKVRGDKKIIPALLRHAKANRIPQTPYIIVQGQRKDVGEELRREAAKQLGGEAVGVFQAGAAITINSGPDIVAILVKGKKRR